MIQNLRLALLASADLLIGFVVQWYLLITLGPGATTDAYIAAQTIPALGAAIFGLSLLRVLVPMLSQLEGRAHFATVWGAVAVVLPAFAALGLLLAISAGAWAGVLFPGFDGPTLALTVSLTRVQMLVMVLSSLVMVFTASCQARGRFERVEAMQVLTNVVTLTSLPWVLERYGIAAMPWLAVMRNAILLLWLGCTLGFARIDAAARERIRDVPHRIKPLVLGSSIYKSGPLIDRLLASLDAPGSMTLFNFAQSLYVAGSQIVDRSVSAPLIPGLAREVAARNWLGFSRLWGSRLSVVVLLVLAAFVVLLLVGDLLLEPVLASRQFSEGDVERLYGLLIAFGGFGLGAVAGQVLSGAFYALGDTATPAKIGILCFFVGVVAKIVGVQFAGTLGLALATSIQYLVSAFLMLLVLRSTLRKSREA